MTPERYLKERLSPTPTAAEAADRFAEMCKLPLQSKEDRLLYETGVFDFFCFTDGKPMYFFSLTRQFDGEEDEFMQLHLYLLYEPTAELEKISRCKWGDTSKADKFMKKVRADKAYALLKDVPCAKLCIDCGET